MVFLCIIFQCKKHSFVIEWHFLAMILVGINVYHKGMTFHVVFKLLNIFTALLRYFSCSRNGDK